MKKTFAQLKRDLSEGKKLKCLEHSIRPEKVGNINEIGKTQSNALTTIQNGKPVWLRYPESSNLVEYEDNTFTFYDAGYRELTAEERKHIENMNELINKSYHNPYGMKKQYGKEHDCEYLIGHDTVRGKRFDRCRYNKNQPCIQDNSIKGEKLYTFEIVA